LYIPEKGLNIADGPSEEIAKGEIICEVYLGED
jgi:hypothetical protein